MSNSQHLVSALPATSPLGVHSLGRIATIESLREHLQWAIELEHFTIPPYLCALCSLDAGRNPEATELVSSVLVEEMLHMTLAANLLNAVGRRPQLDNRKMLQGYPRPLPHSDRSLEISLFRFGPEAIETFLKIERLSPTGAPPEGDNYETIGQFYDAIKQGFRELSAALGEANLFCGDPARQVTDQHFYSGGGRIIAINNLATDSLHWRKSWNKGRAPAISKFGMETATCSILSVIRSPTITAFRNSNSAGGIAAETPHDQGPPVIRKRQSNDMIERVGVGGD